MSHRWKTQSCSILGLLLAACGGDPGGTAAAGGTAGSGGQGGSGGNDGSPVVVSIYAIQDGSHAEWPGIDRPVIVNDVVVTAVEKDGTESFFVQVPVANQDAAYGTRYSGIYCFRSPGVTLAVGDLIDLEGVYVEYPPAGVQTVSEITITSVTITGTGNVPLPEVLPAADISTGGSQSEAYEGVLVRVENVALLNANPNPDGDFGEFSVVGGLWVDDTLYRDADFVGRLAADFVYIQGPLHYEFDEFRLLPRDANDMDANLATKPTVTIYQLQSPDDPNPIAPASGVTVVGAVVTAVRPSSTGDGLGDFFIQTPQANYDTTYQNLATYGSVAAYSGILCSRIPATSNEAVAVGDVVTVEGLFQEYFDRSQITFVGGGLTSVSVTGTGAVPPPEVLTASTIADGGQFAEAHEGVLVKVNGVVLVTKNPDAVDCEDRGEFTVSETLISAELHVDDTFFYDAELEGRVALDFTFIQGPLDFSYGHFKIEPRSSADISVANNAPSTLVTIYQIQDLDCASTVVVSGDFLRIETVIVTGLRAGSGDGDFTVQIAEADYDATYGSSYSGLYISRSVGSTPTVAVGAIVNVEGLYTEYFNRSQISPTAITVVSADTGVVPSATVITDPADIATGGALAEEYQGVLVQVNDVLLTNANPNTNGDFGEFTVTGDLWVDDTFFYDAENIGRAAIDFNFIRGPLDYTYNNSRLLPRNASDIDVKTGAPTTLVTIYDLQDVSATNHPADGSRVRIENVIVTATAFYGGDSFFVQMADVDATSGPQFSGIYIYRQGPTTPVVDVGDVINIEGAYTEFVRTGFAGSTSEITPTSIESVSSGAAVPTTAVIASPGAIATGGADEEAYEGVFVEVQGVTVTNANPETPDRGEFEVTGNLRIDDALWPGCELTGRIATSINFIRGPLHFDYGNSKLLPRDAADMDAVLPVATVYPIYDIQDVTAGNHPAADSRVGLVNVVVTAVAYTGGDAFFVQMADADATSGPAFSGIYVYRSGPVTPVVAVGDVVDVEGQYEEYARFSDTSGTTVSELIPTSIMVKSSGATLPTTTVVATPADIATGGTLADDYEGVMVEVQSVALVTANPDSPDDNGEFTVTGDLRIGDDLWPDAEVTGRAASNFTFIRGPLHYDYGESKIVPRDATDIQ